MTGYGQAMLENDRYQIQAEIKSVNGKFLEMNMRLPRLWQHKEVELRTLLQKFLERGTVYLSLNIQYKNAEDVVQPVNSDVAAYYINQLKNLANQHQVDVQTLSGNFFQLPGILSAREQESDEACWNDIKNVFLEAYQNYNQFRIEEGKMLEQVLAQLCLNIQQYLSQTESYENERIAKIKERLLKEISQIKNDNLDNNRFEQELIYYIEKLDISEEKSRLQQHCKFFLETMKIETSGKKLSFISQEMGREINTIGSKANHAEMQKKVVAMKDELEKIKEQLNNVI